MAWLEGGGAVGELEEKRDSESYWGRMRFDLKFCLIVLQWT